MNITLEYLINTIKEDKKCPAHINITNLLRALEELNDMTGLKDIKNDVAEFVTYIITPSEDDEDDEEIFYNMVITGPPGVGKTKLGNILAKVLLSCNIIKSKTTISAKNYKTHLVWWMNFVKQQLYDASYDMWLSNTDLPEVSQRLSWIDKVATDIYNDMNSPTRNTISFLEDDVMVTILNRAVLLGSFQGHTIENTKKLLEKGKDGVFILDELYTMLVDDGDSFGIEAINYINEFMSLNPKIPFIFMGYKDKIYDTVFKAQPGFESRVQWYFNIDSYSYEELAQIFMTKINIKLDSSVDVKWLTKILSENKYLCKNYARAIAKLRFRSKVALRLRIYKEGGKYILNRQDILNGITSLKKEIREESVNNSIYM